VKKDALALSGTNSNNAANALSTINPIYSKMATGTVGLAPQQKADALTASAQANGGGMASAVGQGGLYAARTGNAGAATAAIDDAARSAGVQSSKDALDVQNQSDQLAQQNQRIGLAGLNGIYQDATGQADAALNTANQAQPSFLSKLALTGVQAAGQAAGAFAKGCWVAAELYGGWNEPRTVAVRRWLHGDFSNTAIGRFIVRLYIRHGERVAKHIQTDRVSRWALRKVFDAALRRAVK
jgi:hypothetical protein